MLQNPDTNYCVVSMQAIHSLQIDVLNQHLFLTAKPVIYLVNLSEKDYIRKKNKWLVLSSFSLACKYGTECLRGFFPLFSIFSVSGHALIWSPCILVKP